MLGPMLEPPSQGSGGRAAERGAESGFGTGWAEPAPGDPEPVASQPRPTFDKRGWHHYPARVGVLLIVLAAVLGAAFTVVSHRDPGLVLGIFVFVGTAAGGIVVRARSAYLLIPVPAPAYVVAAAIAGLVHDRAADTTRTALALSATQWIADGFIAMAAATVLAAVIAAGRWVLGLGSR
jgi:hypothetical protein